MLYRYHPSTFSFSYLLTLRSASLLLSVSLFTLLAFKATGQVMSSTLRVRATVRLRRRKHFISILFCIRKITDPLQIALLVLVVVNDVGVAVSKQTLSAPLASDTTLLVSTEDGLRCRLLPTVDEHTASLEAQRNPLGGFGIFSPDTSTKTGVCVVGAGDDFVLVRPRLSRNDGTCICVSMTT